MRNGMMTGWCAALATVAAMPALASAEGLRRVGPATSLVAGAARETSPAATAAFGFGDATFAVADGDGAATNRGLFVRRIADSYQLSGTPIEAFPTPMSLVGGARLDGGGAVLFWSANSICCGGETYRTKIAADGSVTAASVSVTGSRPGHQSGVTALPLSDGRTLLLYADGEAVSGQSQVSARSVFLSAAGDQDGQPIDLEAIHTGQQAPADGVQLADGAIVAAFHHVAAGRTEATVFGRRFTAAGAPIGARLLLARTDAQHRGSLRLAALPDGGFVAVWIDGRAGLPRPYGRLFRADGRPRGAAFAIGDTPDTQSASLDVAALPDGRFVVAGSLFDAALRIKMARLFGPQGEKIGAPVVLQTVSLAETAQSVGDLHIAAVADLIGSPAAARDVYVAWTRQRPFGAYDLAGQALRAD